MALVSHYSFDVKPAKNFRVERVNETARHFDFADLHCEEGYLVVSNSDDASVLAIYAPLCWEAVIFGDHEERS